MQNINILRALLDTPDHISLLTFYARVDQTFAVNIRGENVMCICQYFRNVNNSPKHYLHKR